MKAYRRLPIDEGEVMPAHRPYYPSPRGYYRDVEFQLIYFRANPAAVREHLPEPLEADPEGLAVAFSIKVPFCSAYGAFNEAGLSVRCSFRGQPAFFNSHLYLDNVAAICAGREIWGAPKEYAEVEIEMRRNMVYSQTVKEGIPIMTLTSDVSQPATADEIIPMFPSYRLKLIPRADGPGPAIKQIVNASPEDVVTSKLFKGNGMIEFGRSANSDLSVFEPQEIVGAFYHVSTYTEVYGEIVHDYLK
jgi:acetoacetate decarboxylase